MRKAILVLGVLMLISASGAYASGLAIPEQGAAALGMSAAMTARSEDLSSIFYNPAGIDYVEGFELYAGVTPIIPKHKYSPLREEREVFEDAESESKVFLPPQLYAAWRVHSNVVLGLGVFSPFGLGTEWNREWAGRYTSTFAEITTVYINPTVAVNVNEKLSLGFGASYITSKATIEKMVDTGGSLGLGTNTALDSEFALEGDGTAFSMNVGAILRPLDNVRFGVSYRWNYDMEYEGDAKFTHSDVLKKYPYPKVSGMTLYDAVSAQMPPKQSGTATLNMPWMLNMGVLYDVSPVWDLSADVDVVGWSRYEKLTIDFADDKPADEQSLDKDWKNSVILRGGTSYDLNEKTVLRGGVLFDKNPVPDETIDGQLPDANRYGISIGAGYRFGKIRVDAGYMLLFFSRREKHNGVGFGQDITGDGEINRFDVPFGYPVGNGVYKSRAHLFSVAATFAF